MTFKVIKLVKIKPYTSSVLTRVWAQAVSCFAGEAAVWTQVAATRLVWAPCGQNPAAALTCGSPTPTPRGSPRPLRPGRPRGSSPVLYLLARKAPSTAIIPLRPQKTCTKPRKSQSQLPWRPESLRCLCAPEASGRLHALRASLVAVSLTEGCCPAPGTVSHDGLPNAAFSFE